MIGVPIDSRIVEIKIIETDKVNEPKERRHQSLQEEENSKRKYYERLKKQYE